MLSFFRNFAKSWAASGIMALLMLTFLLLSNPNVRDTLRMHASNAVIEAGSRSVSADEFRHIFQNAQERLERNGEAITPDQAAEQGLDQTMLGQLANQVAYAEALSRMGINPSKDVVGMEFARIASSGQQPEFTALFDPITRRLDEQRYRYFISQLGMTQDEFEQAFRDTVADQEFASAATGGFTEPLTYAAVRAAILLESRDASFIVIPLSSVPSPPAPTDAQLNDLLQKNREALTIPESRKLTVVRFSAKALAPTMPADPALVQQQFQANIAKYGKPELRSLVEIPLKSPGMAAAVAARLRSGEDPTVVAKSVGVGAVTYADQPQTAVTDQKAGAAAFRMQAGEVSGPVQGDLSTVILKVTKVTPAQPASLEAARPQIEADLRQVESLDAVYKLTDAFDKARESGASIADAAQKAGAIAVSLGPVTAQGVDVASGQQNPALTEKLLKTAFGLQQGGDSEVEQDAGKGEYYAVHIDQVLPPQVRTLADPRVRAVLTQRYFQEFVLGALKAKADEAQKALEKGQSIDAVAAKVGGHVGRQAGMRGLVGNELAKAFGPQLLQAMFAAKAGGVFNEGSQQLQGLVVGKIDAVRPADPSQVALVLGTFAQNDDKAFLEGLSAAARVAAVKSIKPRTDLTMARQAIQVDQATIDRLNAKAKPAGRAK